MPFVCEKCIGDDPGLQQFIKANGESSNTCNYCNIQTNKKVDLNLC